MGQKPAKKTTSQPRNKAGQPRSKAEQPQNKALDPVKEKTTTTQLNMAKTKKMIALVFVVLLMVITVKGAFEAISLRYQEKTLEQEYQEKLAEKEKLEKTKEYINSEAYIEQTARDLLKMVKPGEILYVLKDKDGKDGSETLEKPDIPVPDVNPENNTDDEETPMSSEGFGGEADEAAQ